MGKDKIPKKKEFATSKAILMAIAYLFIYILLPIVSTSAIETFLPWIDFDFFTQEFILFVGIGITLTGFFAILVEPKLASLSGALNIIKYGFIIFQTINLYQLMSNITLDLSGIPLLELNFSMTISVNFFLPFLYGTLVIGGQLLNIGRFAFLMFTGSHMAMDDHYMLKKNQITRVKLKGDILALIEIDDQEIVSKKGKKEKPKDKKKEEKIKEKRKAKKPKEDVVVVEPEKVEVEKPKEEIKIDEPEKTEIKEPTEWKKVELVPVKDEPKVTKFKVLKTDKLRENKIEHEERSVK